MTGILTATGLGAFTVLHPCPLSVNAAAISYLLSVQQQKRTASALVLFVLGEISAFALLGFGIASGVFKIPALATFLQEYIIQILAPTLILVGMVLTGLLFKNQRTISFSGHFPGLFAKFGTGGSFILGLLIAFSFCPLSAALFFGVLIPTAVAENQTFLLPLFFGLGTAAPLIVIATILSRGLTLFNRKFFSGPKVGHQIRSTLGGFLILLGLFMSLRYTFKVL